MPDITYTATITERMDEMRIREIAGWDTVLAGPVDRAKIDACRQWVAENPKYPDGAIAFVETAGHLPDVAEMVEGRWHRSGVTVSAVPVDGDVKVIRVLHAPPTIRDHLHAIGLDDEAIRQVNGGYTASISRNVIRACEEAEGL